MIHVHAYAEVQKKQDPLPTEVLAVCVRFAVMFCFCKKIIAAAFYERLRIKSILSLLHIILNAHQSITNFSHFTRCKLTMDARRE